MSRTALNYAGGVYTNPYLGGGETGEELATIEVITPSLSVEFVPPYDIPPRAEVGRKLSMSLNVHNASTHYIVNANIRVKIQHSTGAPVFSSAGHEFRLMPNETRAVRLLINIPIDAPAGAYTVIGSAAASLIQ